MLVNLSKEDILRLAQIVREETGNLVQEENHSMLQSRMRTHVMKLGFVSMADYWKHFSANEKDERHILQGLMTTHYTFFFREYAHFEALGDWFEQEKTRLQERWNSKQIPVRLWSAACSRGQEVYSLAMLCEEHLFKKHGIPFEIVGTDIDPESVKYGENGVYPLKEVNTIPQNFLNDYWKKGAGAIKDFAAVLRPLKEKTRFGVANLLELNNFSEKSSFDIIFCRNVFIYFSEENVRKIALDLEKKLLTGGLLISGLSEPLRFSDFPLKSLSPSVYAKGSPNGESKSPVSAKIPVQPGQSLADKVAPIAAAKPKTYQVLCVDDSPTIQMLIKKIFSKDPLCAGVDIANHGGEAREKLNNKKYDLITLDIHMPVVNGIEFLEKHYKRKSDPPVLMVSSVNRTDLELATKSLTLGAYDYVEKPAMNNLQKSSEEILTKSAMARRATSVSKQESAGSFDSSIAKVIIVPDASQCLRVVYASDESKSLLEQVVRGQKAESRSPALVIVWHEGSSGGIGSEILKWSDHQLNELRKPTDLLKPNTIYMLYGANASMILPGIKMKTVSLQALDAKVADLQVYKKATSLQFLLDESIAQVASSIESRSGIKVSDITPATSFPSLSVEFFAHLRKANAA